MSTEATEAPVEYSNEAPAEERSAEETAKVEGREKPMPSPHNTRDLDRGKDVPHFDDIEEAPPSLPFNKKADKVDKRDEKPEA